MFLATTGLEEYWDKEQKILFLGEWCITNKSKLKGVDYEILPYHWPELKDAKGSLQYLVKSWSTIVELISVWKRLREFESKLISLENDSTIIN